MKVLSLALIGFAAASAIAQSRPAITGVSHLSVYSPDMAKADQFYQHELGGFKASDPENPAGTRYYFSQTEFVEVLPLPANYTSINRLDHTAFATANAEGLRKYMASKNVTVPAQVTKGSDGSQWFDVKDPEDNTIEFVQAPAKLPTVDLSNAVGTKFIHVGFMVHDEAKENAFYRDILGFRPYWRGGPTETKVAWISQQVPDGNVWLEYMMTAPGVNGSRYPADHTQQALGTQDHLSIGVTDIRKAYEKMYVGDRLTAKMAPVKIARDGKWQINLWDTEGTRVEVMEFKPAVKPCCTEFTAPHPSGN